MSTIEDLSVMVHYAPGDRPLCGSESCTAITTEEPALVKGCQPCGQEAAGPGTMPALPPERLVNARLLEDRSGYGKAH